MARTHGRFSQLYVSVTSSGSAAPLLYAATASQSLTTDQQEVTAFGDTSKVYVAGLPDGTLQFTGFLSDAASTGLSAAALDGVARKWYFYPFTATTVYSYGTGFFDWTMQTGVSAATAMSGSMKPATGVTLVGF
jgi:hypothetical protein